MYNYLYDENIDYSNSDPNKFAPAIKYLREKNNLSLKALSNKISVSVKTLEKLETEGPTYITPSVKKICEFYGLACPETTNSKTIKTDESNNIAKLLKETRENLNKTIKNVADDTNISKATIYNLESGRICKKDNYYILFDYYNLDKNLLNEFIENTDEFKQSNRKKYINKNQETNLLQLNNTSNEKNNNEENNNDSSKNDILAAFNKQLSYDNPFMCIVNESIISYGVQFYNLGYSSNGNVNLFYPIIINNSLDPCIIKKIKMEYLLFLDEYKKVNSNSILNFTLCIIGNRTSTFTDFKEILFDLFDKYENFEVKTYYISDLIKESKSLAS